MGTVLHNMILWRYLQHVSGIYIHADSNARPGSGAEDWNRALQIGLERFPRATPYQDVPPLRPLDSRDRLWCRAQKLHVELARERGQGVPDHGRRPHDD